MTIAKSVEQLLAQYGGIAMEKQIELGNVIGTNSWSVDITTGEISFGEQLTFPMQILGSWSHVTNTWLWAWANTISNLPQNLLEQAYALKKFGEENEIDLLTVPEFDAEDKTLHLIGMIVSGIFNTSGYYKANYGKGTMLLTIKSEIIDKSHNDLGYQKILTVFPELINLYEMDYKAALSHYLNAKGFSVMDNDRILSGVNGQIEITAEFDEFNRMKSIGFK